MRAFVLFAISALVASGQTPVSLSDPWTAGVTQVTATINATGGVLTSVSVPANTPCTANATGAIHDTTGGIGGYVTFTCSGGVFTNPGTLNSAGSNYTTGTSFLTLYKALTIKVNDHTHPNPDPTSTGPPACAITCIYACAGHSVIALTPKIASPSGYTFATPSSSCSTVQANATPGSCPAYTTGTSYTVSSIANGATTSVTMLDTTIPLSTDNSTMTPILFSSVTGGTISPTIMGLSSLNSGGNPDGSWYAGDVVHDNGGGHTTFNVYYQKYDGVGGWSFVKVPTNTAITAPGSIILGGCTSSFTGTVGSSVTVLPGMEDILTATTGPTATQGYHHSTFFNVSGSPWTSTSSWLTEVRQGLNNPATADGAIFTFSHSRYTLGAQSSAWPMDGARAVAQLVREFPGRIHVQVLDGQLGLGVPGATYGASEYTWDLLNSSVDSPIWGNASDDSYTTTTTGVGKSYTYLNVDSTSTANIMDAYTTGRFYFARGSTNALRCGHTGLTIVCNNYNAEPPTASATREWIWIGEGGRILQVDLNVARSKYVVTGKEGKYVRVATTTNGSWGSSSVAQTQAYVVGNLYGESLNWFYPNGNNGQTWSQPFWINYGGVKNANTINK